MKILVVVDIQNDFVTGALGSPEAQAIIPNVVEYIKNFDGRIICTRDTHNEDYLNTLEGIKLPVSHCINGTNGWEICDEVFNVLPRATTVINKPTFGSTNLISEFNSIDIFEGTVEEIYFLGLCTDICVISNAMLAKTYFPETPIKVVANCCAGVTPESHERALEAMKMCHIDII